MDLGFIELWLTGGKCIATLLCLVLQFMVIHFKLFDQINVKKSVGNRTMAD